MAKPALPCISGRQLGRINGAGLANKSRDEYLATSDAGLAVPAGR
jgi:hypothetical protein